MAETAPPIAAVAPAPDLAPPSRAHLDLTAGLAFRRLRDRDPRRTPTHRQHALTAVPGMPDRSHLKIAIDDPTRATAWALPPSCACTPRIPAMPGTPLPSTTPREPSGRHWPS